MELIDFYRALHELLMKEGLGTWEGLCVSILFIAPRKHDKEFTNWVNFSVDLNARLPSKGKNGYCWPPGELAPRLRFLKSIIRQLEKKR
jgi:hypothetical protein